MSDITKRILIKRGNGVPTIPPSADHRDGTWSATDIYEGEFYLDLLSNDVYTNSGGVIVNITATSINQASKLSHSVKLAENMTKGQAAYVSGATGTNMLVSKADNTTDAMSSKTMGLIDATGVTNDIVNIITEGLLDGLNTSTATIGDPVWLGTSGNLLYGAANKPVAPAHMVFMGIVTRVNASNGEIFVKVQNGFELDELHNVLITAEANNDVLYYDSASQLWKNATIDEILGTSIPTLKPNETFRGITLQNNSTTVTTYGGVTMSTSASNLAQSVASTNYASKQVRLRYYASVVSAGRYTGTRGSALLWYIGGGFRYVCDVYISDTAYGSGCRQFYGLQGSTADLTYSDSVLVSTLINCIGVGSDSADTNLQVFHNDGTGTCTKVDLGASFPANRDNTNALTTVYSIEIYNASGSSNVNYRVINKETGATATGTLTTNLPASTQGLNFFASRCMGTGITNTGQFDLLQMGVYSI